MNKDYLLHRAAPEIVCYLYEIKVLNLEAP